MYKLLFLLFIPSIAVCQAKNLGTYYECITADDGKTQFLKLASDSTFEYNVFRVMDLKGSYRVNRDSLFLISKQLPKDVPLIFHIKRNKLVAFNGHRQEPEWYLKKIR